MLVDDLIQLYAMRCRYELQISNAGPVLRGVYVVERLIDVDVVDAFPF